MTFETELSHASTLPAAWYGGDKAVWERERRAIFGRVHLIIDIGQQVG